MKRLALLTIPLLAAFAVGGITAGAETEYPNDESFVKTLTLSSLNDYAIEDGIFAFADGNSIKVINGDNYSKYSSIKTLTEDFTAVDIVDGVIYCLNDGKSYIIDDTGTQYTFVEHEHTFPEEQLVVVLNGFHYYFKDGQFKIFNESDEAVATYEGFSNLKEYSETAYAVKNNSLYKFVGAEQQELKFAYAAKPSDIVIPIGQAGRNLKKYAPVQIVDIESGSYMTEIDLDVDFDNLSGGNFTSLNIVKAEEGTSALLLYKNESVAIVSIRDSAYAIFDPDAKIKNSVQYTTEKPLETSAQIMGGNIYASPFVAKGTITFSNATGITVKVLNRIENEILECAFYEIEYYWGEEKVTGYVAEGLLTEDIREDNQQPTEIPDPEYSEKSDTKTILIIFAVVVLVLAAIAYIGYVSAKGKKKGKKKKEENEEK